MRNLFARLREAVLRRFRREELVLDDAVFGKISTYRGDGVWGSCGRDRPHWVCIYADDDGPTDAQRVFYLQLLERLSEVERQAKAYIESAGTATDELGIYHIEICSDADCAQDSFVIEYCDDEAEEVHRVQFRHGKPVFYGIDD